MATLRELASLGNGYDMGAGGTVEGYDPSLLNPAPTAPNGLTVTDTPNPLVGGVGAPQAPQGPPAWQHPGQAFAPDVSQNAPRLFQDPTTGEWTLSEHGNFRNVPTDQVQNAQGYVSQFWGQNPNGFIQPGAPGYQPGQAMSNNQYGRESNWQSLWTNAGMTPPTQSPTPTPLIGQAQPPSGGSLSELSNPERVAQLSQSSYGSDNPFLVR